jgi:hypothetical protein
MTRTGIAVLAWTLVAVPAGARAACSLAQGDFDGNGTEDVRIAGDARAQYIVVIDSPETYAVQIDCNDDGDFTDSGDVDTGTLTATIETFELRPGGKDRIAYRTTGDAMVKNLLVAFGPPGADGNSLNVTTGLRSGSSLVVDVIGSAGRDSVFMRSQSQDSSLVLRGDLGAGTDTLDLTLSNSVRSSISVDFALGAGFGDAYLGCGTTDASRVAMNLEGSNVVSQPDALTFRLDGVATNDARIQLKANLLAGNDVGRVALEGFEARAGGKAYVRLAGGNGNDVLAVESTSAPAAVDGRLDVTLEGGAGNDILTYDLGGDFSGSGRVRFRVDGGDGADLVASTVFADSSTSTPSFDLAFLGGRGADVVYVALSDPAGGAQWTPYGRVRLDGGSEEDRCLAPGTVPVDLAGCEL